MFDFIFTTLTKLDAIFWGYVGFVLVVALGIYFSIKSRLFQLRQTTEIFKIFYNALGKKEGERGIHPLKAFFASAGGLIGIGNVVGIVTAVQLGGPGSLIWVWVAGVIGGIAKYCEIFLGLRYRQENQEGGYDGGPMYYLSHAFFRLTWMPIVVAFLLCIYGVDIYQFTVVTESVSTNWGVNHYLVISTLILAILYAGRGGIHRIGKICSLIIPIFIFSYFVMCLWVVMQHLPEIPSMFGEIFRSAFTGHAAVGGFTGATVMMTIQHGIARAAYSSDIGIGYDAIIHSESSVVDPQKQARLAIFGVFIDNMICTLSILVVLVSGVWKAENPIPASHLVQTALSLYFPFMQIFMPLFFIMIGYTTIIAYLYVGQKCALYLSSKCGKSLYTGYTVCALIAFSFIDQKNALLVMSVCGALLLIINTLAMLRLRKEIVFERPLKKKMITTDS